MEPLVVWLLIFVVYFCVLYFTVKAAVRDGILAARQAQQDAPNEKKDGYMPSFFLLSTGSCPIQDAGGTGPLSSRFAHKADGTLRALGVF